MRTSLWTLCAAALAAIIATGCGSGYNEDELILATTTSLNDSGLLDELTPIFEAETGVNLKVIAVGTGAALRMGVEGNADALLTHAPDAEQALVDNGDVTSRTLVAYNDFVIVGPRSDPAKIRGLTDADAAMQQIAIHCQDSDCQFASRGDDSGTHKKEVDLWEDTPIDATQRSEDWYLEVGQGMSATLIVANQRRAYALSDRGTFLALSRHLDDLVVLVQGDTRLLNFYSVMEVDGSKGRINTVAAAQFRDFLLRASIQTIIGDYLRQQYGRPLFIPAAGETEESIVGRGAAR